LASSAIRVPARSTSLLQSSWKPASTKFAAAFSTSRQFRNTAGEVDAELVAKLESELQMEKEIRDEDEVPTSVKDYLENGPFEIIDTEGQEEVVLTRKFGDET
jgi:complement component 1 Q subcomponent-binding protein